MRFIRDLQPKPTSAFFPAGLRIIDDNYRKRAAEQRLIVIQESYRVEQVPEL
jgi:hypothetical protein